MNLKAQEILLMDGLYLENVLLDSHKMNGKYFQCLIECCLQIIYFFKCVAKFQRSTYNNDQYKRVLKK
jgi:hypothetical protein